ncbi:unnamed protein product [Fusarium graminearum]|uniref:Chromosome 1, complete genome n=1 Tax=Gibberella zeae (strain ATCC MYA-4620 / CBS 123657 / FGSC 9075 / NRRL 31084 / PH-1) TaxID=229533 RepID=A0A098D8T1_GIBZE|nr:unnamed protein product [Fusarium graminearum]CZS78638.1 unnamed protein product [Fusarium graminearum]
MKETAEPRQSVWGNKIGTEIIAIVQLVGVVTLPLGQQVSRHYVEGELAVMWYIQQRGLKLESRKGPKRGL